MRAATSGFRITILEMVNTVGNLYTPQTTESKKDARFRNLCHLCYNTDEKTVTPLNSRPWCPVHDVLDEVSLKGKEDDEGNITPVGDADEVKEAKASELPKKLLELVPVPADDAEQHLMAADGAMYVFIPNTPDPFYSSLVREMDDAGRLHTDSGDVMLVGSMRLRDNELLVTLQRWNSHLVIKELLRPEQIKEFPAPIHVDVDKKGKALFKTVLQAATEEFDPENFKDVNRERLAQWVAARREGVTIDVKPATKKTDTNEDYQAQLEAALALVKAKKGA